MPGVLMLQTLVEAGAWLLRITDDFRHSVIVLREAKNVKYGNFMEPGKSLVVTAELVETQGRTGDLQGQGRSGRQRHGLGPVHAGSLQPARPQPGLAGCG